MKTMLKLRSGEGPGAGSDLHEVEKTPEHLAQQINDAHRSGDKLVTFRVPRRKDLSVLTERIEAIWQE